MKHASILQRAHSLKRTVGALIVATTLLLAGCDRAPDHPIYSIPVYTPGKTELQYELVKLIDSKLTKLNGIAVDGDGRIYAVGVGGVNVLDADGKLLANWKRQEELQCVAVAEDGTVYVASAVQVVKLDGTGKEVGSWGSSGTGPGQFGRITSIAVRGVEVLVADADNRCVHRFTVDGDYSNDIGRADRWSGFLGLIVPSAHLDCVIDAQGKAVITNPGRLRVETYSLDGKLESYWGEPGMAAHQFCGCCNPTDIALTREGHVVTTEKGIFRVKVYDRTGKMLAFIKPKFFSRRLPGFFSRGASGMDVAVDGKGRIYVADPGDGKIRVFALLTEQ